MRCVNYDAKEHPVSYPLPQNGEIEATDEVCEPCGSPRVVVHTTKGPWKICLDPDCETKPPRKGPGAKKTTKKAAKTTTKKATKKGTKKATKKSSASSKKTASTKSDAPAAANTKSGVEGATAPEESDTV